MPLPFEHEDEELEFAALIEALADEPIENDLVHRPPAGTTLDNLGETSASEGGARDLVYRPKPGTTLDEAINHEPFTPEERDRYMQRVGGARDPFGLTTDDKIGTVAANAEREFATAPAFEPAIGDAHPIATPEPRPLEPEFAPSADWQNPGPSPMWEKYSNQGARMGSGGSGAGLQALAQRGGSSGGGDGMLIGAMIADLALNRGRNTGGILHTMAVRDGGDMGMDDLDRAHKMAQIAELNRRGTQRQEPRPVDPRLAQWRDESLKLRQAQWQARKAADDAKAAKAEALATMDSAETQRMREIAIANGAKPEMVAQMTGQDILDWRPQLGAAAAREFSQAEWNRRNTKTQQQQIAKEGRAEEAKIAGEGRQAERDETKDVARQTEEYGKEVRVRGLSRGRAALNNVKRLLPKEGEDIEGFGAGGLKPSFWLSERGKALRRAVNRLLDTELRMATGAAAPPSEQDTFRGILGVSALDSDEDLRDALEQSESILDEQEGFVREMYPKATNRSGGDLVDQDPTSLGVTDGVGPRVDRVVKPKAKKIAQVPDDKDLGVTYE